MSTEPYNDIIEIQKILYPCPFCGGSAGIFLGIHDNEDYFSTICSNCNCVVGDFETLSELLRFYNERFSYPVSNIVINLLSDDKKIDNLLNSLSSIAISVNPVEYGLPLTDKGEKELLRKVVLRWIASL